MNKKDLEPPVPNDDDDDTYYLVNINQKEKSKNIKILERSYNRIMNEVPWGVHKP